jgi:inorganic pyrophosphatase
MPTSIDQIPLHAPGGYNVVVETPRGSRTKFAYDRELGLFRAKKLLAMGLAFPFPFGFFASTKAADGDPLDAMLLTDADLVLGSVVRCRVLGGFALEDENGGRAKRNDRLLVVPLLLHQDRPPYQLSDIPAEQLQDLEDFLMAYPAADGKRAKLTARLDKSAAEKIIEAACR